MATFRVSKINNGSFELWYDDVYTDHIPHPLGWDDQNYNGESHFTKSTDIYHTGNASLKATSNGDPGPFVLYTPDIQVQSTSYTLKFWFYVETQGDGNYVAIRQYDVDGNYENSIIDANIGQRTTGVWTEVTKTFGKGSGNDFVLNSDTVKIKVFPRCGNSNAVVYYDDFDVLGETLTLPRGFVLPVDESESILQKSAYTSSGEIKAAASYDEPLKRFKLGVSRIDDTDYVNLRNFLESDDVDYTYGSLLFTDDNGNEYWGKFNWNRFVAMGESYQNIAASLNFDELHHSFCKSSITLVEFESFKEKSWGRLTPDGDTIIEDGGTTFTYKDYFVKGKFPVVAEEVDVLKGGFGAISNITLKLTNSDNLIKKLRKVSLTNTYVSIYELESVGGTFKKSNAVLKYRGVVSEKGVAQIDENRIEIQLIDSFFKKDVGVLKKRIKKEGDSVDHLKGNYPNADDSAIDQWVPIVLGKNSVYIKDPGQTYIRAITPNITSPALLINVGKQEFIFADHPIKTSEEDLIPSDENNRNDIRNKIGATFLYDEGAKQLLPLYNGDTDDYHDGESGEGTKRYLVKIPTNVPCVQGFILPESISKVDNLYGGNVAITEDDGQRVTDDNKLLETGVNVKSFTHFIKPYDIVWFKFPEIDIDPDPLVGGFFLEIKAVSGGGHGSFVVRTTGLEEKVEYPDKLQDLKWISESEVIEGQNDETLEITPHPTIYRIRKSSLHGGLDGEPHGQSGHNRHIFSPTSDDLIWRSAPLTKKFTRPSYWAESHQRFWGGPDPWVGVIQQAVQWKVSPMPPLNWESLDNNGPGALEYDVHLFDKERIKSWEFGIMGWGNLQIESVWLRLYHGYWKGGKVFVPNWWKHERWIMDIPPSDPSYKKYIGQLIRGAQQKFSEKEREFIFYKQEIDEKSNTGPIHMILDGYTDTNLTTGTVVQDPTGHMKHMMKFRGKFTEDVQWDSTSFDHVQNLRNKTANSKDYNNQWEFNGYIQEKQQLLSEVLQDMAVQSNSYIYHKNDVLQLKAFDFNESGFINSEGVRRSLNNHDVLDYKYSNQKDLYDSIIIEYGRSSATKKYEGILKITPFETNFYDSTNDIFDTVRDEGAVDNYDIDGYSIGTPWDKDTPETWVNPDLTTLCGKLQNMWLNHFHSNLPDKLHTLPIKADKISNIHTARRLMVGLVHKFTEQRPILEIDVEARHGDLHIGDLIYINHTDFAYQDNSVYLIFGKRSNLQDQTFTFKLIRVVEGPEDITPEPPEPDPTYTINKNVIGQGRITLNPRGPYWYNDEVTITATPFKGYAFDGWSGDISGNTNPLTIHITSNLNITAMFITTGDYDPPPGGPEI